MKIIWQQEDRQLIKDRFQAIAGKERAYYQAKEDSIMRNVEAAFQQQLESEIDHMIEEFEL